MSVYVRLTYVSPGGSSAHALGHRHSVWLLSYISFPV